MTALPAYGARLLPLLKKAWPAAKVVGGGAFTLAMLLPLLEDLNIDATGAKRRKKRLAHEELQGLLTDRDVEASQVSEDFLSSILEGQGGTEPALGANPEMRDELFMREMLSGYGQRLAAVAQPSSPSLMELAARSGLLEGL